MSPNIRSHVTIPDKWIWHFFLVTESRFSRHLGFILIVFFSGWRREVVARGTADGSASRHCDTYYFAPGPTGKKLVSLKTDLITLPTWIFCHFCVMLVKLWTNSVRTNGRIDVANYSISRTLEWRPENREACYIYKTRYIFLHMLWAPSFTFTSIQIFKNVSLHNLVCSKVG